MTDGMVFEKMLDDGRSVWSSKGSFLTLTPAQVQSMGLVEAMREALEASGVHDEPTQVMVAQAREAVGAATEALIDATEDAPVEDVGWQGVEVLGGRTGDGWSWEVVKDGDEAIVCVTNRAAVDEADPAKPVQLQQAAIPLDVLRAIAR